MTTYRSKIDHGFWLIMMMVMLPGIFTPIIMKPTIEVSEILLLILSISLPALLIINIYTNTYYTIDEENLSLRIKSGFIINSRYDISKITKIRNTRTWLSSPALSLDRIELTIGKYNKVVISPRNKAQFINHLKSLNPDIIAEV